MTQSRPNEQADVLIGGAGFAGLALAIALREALGGAFTVTVADPSLGRPGTDARASAIAAAARRLFETLNVWDAVSPSAQPILDMVVSDSKLDDAVRPTFLTFGGEVAPGEPFAHMIENVHLLAALLEKAKAQGVRLLPTAVSGFDTGDKTSAAGAGAGVAQHIDVRLADGETIRARLLVAADGARSAIRERAGIHVVRLVLRPVGDRHDGGA